MITMLLAFVKPLLESNDVYGIRADFIFALGTGGIEVILLLVQIGLKENISGVSYAFWIVLAPSLAWPISGAIWPVLQSYDIEPMDIFSSIRVTEHYEATEANLLAILSDPRRCRKLEEIAVRTFTTENIVFLRAYISYGMSPAIFDRSLAHRYNSWIWRIDRNPQQCIST